MTETDLFGAVGGLSEDDILRIKLLSARCGGWIVWGEEGCTWISIDDWDPTA